jgi:hypothetical protein
VPAQRGGRLGAGQLVICLQQFSLAGEKPATAAPNRQPPLRRFVIDSLDGLRIVIAVEEKRNLASAVYKISRSTPRADGHRASGSGRTPMAALVRASANPRDKASRCVSRVWQRPMRIDFATMGLLVLFPGYLQRFVNLTRKGRR